MPMLIIIHGDCEDDRCCTLDEKLLSENTELQIDVYIWCHDGRPKTTALAIAISN